MIKRMIDKAEEHIRGFIFWNMRKNWGLWFHILMGGVFAKLLIGFKASNLYEVLIATFILALLWEYYEVLMEYKLKRWRIEINYGSVTNWVYDVIGDVLGAMIMAGIIAL